MDFWRKHFIEPVARFLGLFSSNRDGLIGPTLPSSSRVTAKPAIPTAEQLSVENQSLRTQLDELRQEDERHKAQVFAIEEQLRKANHDQDKALLDYRTSYEASLASWTTQKSSFEKEIEGLKTQLKDSQVDYASLLKHLQPSESLEPGDIVAKFSSLNTLIKDTCFTISRAVLTRIPPTFAPLTSLSGDVEKVRALLPGASLLVQSADGAGRPLDDFIEFSFRHIINSILWDHLFSPFHTSLSLDESHLVHEIYEDIRHEQPQLMGAKWRASAYLAIETKFVSSKWIQTFETEVERDLLELISSLLPMLEPDDWFTAAMRQSIIDIGTSALHWDYAVMTSFYSLDFHPFMYDESHPFNAEFMIAHGEHDVVLNPPDRVIAAVTLGLESTECFGTEKPIESVTQMKAEVLTEGYFREG